MISIHAPRTGSDNEDFLRPASAFISIHAPRTGSDAIVTPAAAAQYQFQSTLPARGATHAPHYEHGHRRISIHAPRTGSDRFETSSSGCKQISIHAPRTGSDSSHCSHLLPLQDFNPRSPHGERRSISDGTSADRRFQSTLPARGATYRQLKTIYQQRDFNPRSPHGERLGGLDCFHLILGISIHAPRTGSDAGA